MKTTNEKYNGWVNYPTWVVNLWLTNEPDEYGKWVERAEHAWDNGASVHPQLSASEGARVQLADELREYFQEGVAEGFIRDFALEGCFHDLLGHAIEEVDWQAVADTFLDSLEGVGEYETLKG